MKYVLILCLLLNQTLGLVHGIAHGQQHSKLETVQAPRQADADHSDLFAGHDEETTCQLYDQLCLGSALAGDVVTQTHPAPEALLLAADDHGIHTHQRSLVQARAPPAIFLVS